MFDWNPELYSKFMAERTQPAVDLAQRITVRNPERVIDIGCGPGNSTKVLADLFPNAHIIGADNSEDMIKRARGLYPDIDFITFDAQNDFGRLEKGFDVVFSNACIQWVPDHPKLLADMMSVLKKGGMLAVQIPDNFSEPIHRIIHELVCGEKWSGRIKNKRSFYNMSQSGYFDLLSELTTEFSMWETVYYHRMPSHESILEWYKGTGLRPYLSSLSEPEARELENDVLIEVKKAYPKQKNGEIIFRFPRLFFLALKQ